MNKKIKEIEVLNFDSGITSIISARLPVLAAYLVQGYEYVEQLKVLQGIADKYRNVIKTYIIEEDSVVTARKLSIEGSPTFIFFYKGKEIGRMLGEADDNTLNDFIIETCPDLEKNINLKKVSH